MSVCTSITSRQVFLSLLQNDQIPLAFRCRGIDHFDIVREREREKEERERKRMQVFHPKGDGLPRKGPPFFKKFLRKSLTMP